MKFCFSTFVSTKYSDVFVGNIHRNRHRGSSVIKIFFRVEDHLKFWRQVVAIKILSEIAKLSMGFYRFLFKTYAYKGILFIFVNIEKNRENIDLINRLSSV